MITNAACIRAVDRLAVCHASYFRLKRKDLKLKFDSNLTWVYTYRRFKSHGKQ